MEKIYWSDYDGTIYNDDFIGIIRPITSDTVPKFNMTLGQTIINKGLVTGEVVTQIGDSTLEVVAEIGDSIKNTFNLIKFVPFLIVGIIVYKVVK